MSDNQAGKATGPKKSKYRAGILTSSEGEVSNLPVRHRIGTTWMVIFQASTIVGIIALMILLIKIINNSFGYAILVYKTDPTTLAVSATPIEELTTNDLIAILQVNLTSGRYATLIKEKPFEERSQEELYELVIAEVAKPTVSATFTLLKSILKKDEIIQYAIDNFPGEFLTFRNWVSLDFITSPQSSNPLLAGVRNAILGSLFTIFIAILFAIPMGIMAAIYLEEYARDNWINRPDPHQYQQSGWCAIDHIWYAGIGSLCTCPGTVHQWSVFGFSDPTTANGRTILSAGLDPGAAGLAADHHQRPGSNPGRAQLAARGKLWAGRHQVADCLASCAAKRHPRHH